MEGVEAFDVRDPESIEVPALRFRYSLGIITFHDSWCEGGG